MDASKAWLAVGFVGQASLLAYAIHRQDPVFVLGQATGILVHARNLYFIGRQPAG